MDPSADPTPAALTARPTPARPRPARPGGPRGRRTGVVLLALPSIALAGGLAGCHSSSTAASSSAPSSGAASSSLAPGADTSAGSTPGSAVSPPGATTPAGPATTTAVVARSTTPGAPACPSAASLFALEPTAGARLTATTCSGTWAVVGVRLPDHSQRADLFQDVSGTWRVADESQACASGQLPADIEAGVCDAG